MKALIPAIALLACVTTDCGRVPAARSSSDPPVTYQNSGYGLTFSLPSDWAGYSVVPAQWESRKYRPDLDKEVVVGHGPIIVLRHPRWTPEHPRQDIPIVVFTRAQWQADEQDHIFAGGIEYEISHNGRCVFAVNSRFNADDSVEGWDEAGKIVLRNVAASPHLEEH